MRAALAGRIGPPVVGRPPARVLASPLPTPSTMLVPPQVRRTRSRLLLGLAAAMVAIVIAAAALMADSTSRAPVPEPASTSTSVPTPVTTSKLPTPTLTAPVPVDQGPPGERKGNRGENGNPKKPKGGDDDD
jgi:hypothetical protein